MVVMPQTRVARRSPTDCCIATLPVAAPSVLSIFVTIGLLLLQGVSLATEPGNEDIATKFEQEYVRCVRNEKERVCSAANCCDTEQQYPH